jgi:uncharacterized protein (TIGR01244 family)
MRNQLLLATLAVALLGGVASAQEVTKPAVAGVRNFAKLDATIACGGATTLDGIAELKKLGYASIINLRQASEAGADIDASKAAANGAGVRYIHLPFNNQNPDPAVADEFVKAVVDPQNQPVFVHCGSGNRAAAMWMIKRLVVDGWDAERAATEAAALGLSNEALKKFALDYAASKKK